ncbi:MAG: hypothetical protein R3190_08625 [Thermoanaerobaculia bacterium]|nr:hypothetical protein [Thermoanaerobaculia bacterium]
MERRSPHRRRRPGNRRVAASVMVAALCLWTASLALVDAGGAHGHFDGESYYQHQHFYVGAHGHAPDGDEAHADDDHQDNGENHDSEGGASFVPHAEHASVAAVAVAHDASPGGDAGRAAAAEPRIGHRLHVQAPRTRGPPVVDATA